MDGLARRNNHLRRMNNSHRKPARRFFPTLKMNRLTLGILVLCAIAIGGALYCLSPDAQVNERSHEVERKATPLSERFQDRAPDVETAPVVARQPAQEASSTLPSVTNDAKLALQVAELAEAVTLLEQKTRNLEDRLSRSMRPLPTGGRTEAGLAGKKGELDAQTRRSQAATTELHRFAARFGVVLDERILIDPTFSTPLDKEPGFSELRLAATSSLRVLQAVERKFAADLLERASFQ